MMFRRLLQPSFYIMAFNYSNNVFCVLHIVDNISFCQSFFLVWSMKGMNMLNTG
jgi:hypothetical protein